VAPFFLGHGVYILYILKTARKCVRHTSRLSACDPNVPPVSGMNSIRRHSIANADKPSPYLHTLISAACENGLYVIYYVTEQ